MRLRVFNPDMDFESIKGWIPDERSHAMWCANRFQYPLDKDNFISVLSEMSQRTGDEPFVAVMDDDRTVGFLCYSLNRDIGEGKLKFVIVDPECQGKGIAQEMLHLIISYAFEDVETKRVSLNVFAQNPRAKKSYEKAGFTERKSNNSSGFVYKEEFWDRCSMAIERSLRS